MVFSYGIAHSVVNCGYCMCARGGVASEKDRKLIAKSDRRHEKMAEGKNWNIAHLAVDIEYSPTVVDGDGSRTVKPSTEAADPSVQRWEETAQEKQELYEMEPD